MVIDYIYNEDCFDTMAKFKDNSIDITFTSPPYNRCRNDKYSHYSDNIDDYFAFLCNATREMLRITRKYVFINIQKTYYNKVDVFKFIGEFSDNIIDIIIWEKSNPLPANGSNITNAWEFILVMGDESLQSKNTYTKNHITTTVNTEAFDNHKAVMNMDVSDFIIENFATEGNIIYDPFSGLGTTAISTKKYDCFYIGSEISKQYWNQGNDRIAEYLMTNTSIKLIDIFQF